MFFFVHVARDVLPATAAYKARKRVTSRVKQATLDVELGLVSSA